MIEISIAIFVFSLFAFLVSIFIQLVYIKKLLFIIAAQQDYVAACKAVGKE